MKFYLASGLENRETVVEVAKKLKELGHTQTYDWTAHGDVCPQGGWRLSEVSDKELTAVMEADLVLLLLPGARSAHAALGAALAAKRAKPQKEVWIYSPDGSAFENSSNTCPFYWHSGVRHFTGALQMLLDAIGKEF